MFHTYTHIQTHEATHRNFIFILIAKTTHFGVTLDLYLEIERKSSKVITFVGTVSLLFGAVGARSHMYV